MAVPDTTIATNLNETFDIKVNLFPQFPLNLVLPVNSFSDTINLILGKVIHLGLSIDTDLS